MSKILKTRPLVDPSLSEFIYSVAMTTPIYMKRRLPLKYFNAIKSERSARTFSTKSTTDQKREFLEYLGFRSFWIISNIDSVWDSKFKEILKAYQSKGRKSSLKEIADEGIYITSDKELVYLFTQTSHVVSSQLYRMEQEFFRIKNSQMDWSTKLESEMVEEKRDEVSRSDKFIKLSWVNILSFLNSDKFMEVGAYEISILLMLYQKRDGYVEHEEIKKELNPLIPLNKIIPVERNLLDLSMIQSHVDYRKRSFTITSRGIRTVHQFRDRVLKSFNF